MKVVEDRRYSADYLDPGKRSIANAVQVHFADGEFTHKASVEYPIGHRRRRKESMPLLWRKFEANMRTRFTGDRADAIMQTCQDANGLDAMPVDKFIDLFIP